MDSRVSSVGRIDNVFTDVSSSIIIGDTVQFTPYVQAIAVQREQAVFFDYEFPFSDYTIFSRALMQPAVMEAVKMTTINESPVIQVDQIKVFRNVASSLLQIGSSRLMRGERRVKHIRHLLRNPP